MLLSIRPGTKYLLQGVTAAKILWGFIVPLHFPALISELLFNFILHPLYRSAD